jgi:hypothetical protein
MAEFIAPQWHYSDGMVDKKVVASFHLLAWLNWLAPLTLNHKAMLSLPRRAQSLGRWCVVRQALTMCDAGNQDVVETTYIRQSC